ncbi:formate dehydrogenase accessory sulfurtransferase FdhD, partial [bacterium]|nr:formate dehydrogenase accessory sulfurtransferase FdhD [bacterium]
NVRIGNDCLICGQVGIAGSSEIGNRVILGGQCGVNDNIFVGDDVELSKNKVKTSWIYALAKKINTTPSLYLSAGAIHGTVLCEKSTPLIYMEDVGRHNAVDKISGWMFINGIKASDKILYTTGRLTSEMIIKSALMGIPTLISRSGFTAWGVEIANNLGMTLIGRLRGRRFICLSGEKRLVRDADPKVISDEKPKDNRKAGND